MCITIKIETYWNVNTFGKIGDEIDFVIKIETYWNVNDITLLCSIRQPFIKIETYWNVNITSCPSTDTNTSLK